MKSPLVVDGDQVVFETAPGVCFFATRLVAAGPQTLRGRSHVRVNGRPVCVVGDLPSSIPNLTYTVPSLGLVGGTGAIILSAHLDQMARNCRIAGQLVLLAGSHALASFTPATPATLPPNPPDPATPTSGTATIRARQSVVHAVGGAG
ncbi:MAG: hypothetical protein ACRYHA_11930 [Janthinobacterium lividum]